MAENPFGDEAPKIAKRNYLILVSASKDNAHLAQILLKNIQKNVDSNAAPLWIDAKGIGVFATTDMVAWEIRDAAMHSERRNELQDTRDLLIIEIGRDWIARRDAKTEHWLSSHVGPPRAVPLGHRVPRV